MNCRIAEQELDGYLAGRLSEPVRGEVEAHLAACPACARLATETRQLSALLGDLPRRTLSDAWNARFEAALAERRRAEGVAPLRPVWRGRLAPVLATASLAAALLVGALSVTWQPDPQIALAPVDDAFIQAVLDEHAELAAAQPLTDPTVPALAAQPGRVAASTP